MILHADRSWRDTQLLPWLSHSWSQDSAGLGKVAPEAPKHDGHFRPSSCSPHSLERIRRPLLGAQSSNQPPGLPTTPPVAEATGGHRLILLVGTVLGEGPALMLSPRSEILGSLPASLWHVDGCCCALGFFYTDKVSLPLPVFLPISLSPAVSGFMWESMSLPAMKETFKAMPSPAASGVNRVQAVWRGLNRSGWLFAFSG